MKAIKCHEKAVSIAPYIPYLNDLGCLYFKEKKYSKALLTFEKISLVSPTNLEALNNIGAILHKLKQYSGAIDYYDRVLAIDPVDTVAWKNKGQALEQMGKYTEACQCFMKSFHK